MIPFTGATRLISGQPYNCTSNANLVLSTNQVDYGNSGNKILIGSPLGNLSGQYDEFECSPVFLFHKRRNRAKTRCLWDASIRSPLAEISQRPLRNISKDIFFERSLRRLKYISKKMSFCDLFKTSQIHLKKDVFYVTSLRHLKNSQKDDSVTSLIRLKNISWKYLWIFKNIPQKWFCTDIIHVWTLKTVKKWNVVF